MPDFVHGIPAPGTFIKAIGEINHQGWGSADVFVCVYNTRWNNDLQPLPVSRLDRFVSGKSCRLDAVVPKLDLERPEKAKAIGLLNMFMRSAYDTRARLRYIGHAGF